MAKCKYCQAELAENGTFCPNCGRDNAEPETAPVEETIPVQESAAEETASAEMTAPAEEPVKEEQTAEIKEGIKATPGKIAVAAAAVVVLVAVLVALLVNGLGSTNKSLSTNETQGTEAVETTEAVPATVPADGNPDDETCKGTYTASDAEVEANMATVVATAGDYELTNAQLQIYYWLEVQNFLGTYGSYAYYFGLDYTQPLDTQVCTVTESGTWQQYFLSCALQSWQNYQSLAAEAEKAGYQLEDEYQQELDEIIATFEENAISYGFESAKDFLAYNVGAGAEVEDYFHFMRLYYPGYFYFNSICENFAPTDAEIEAFFTEHEADYTESGITKDGNYVDVRHILIAPEGGTTDEDGNTTYSDAEWEACKASAQAILDQWLAGEATEDSFAALANEKSEDSGSNTNGGLYTDVTVGQMVEPFENWCFDETRQAGDYGLVQTDYGYHIMYFVESRPIWKSYAQSDLITEMANNVLAEANEKYPMTVDYSSILLGYVDLSA